VTFRWRDVRRDWDDEDGTLRDVLIESAGEEDWQRVVVAIRSRGWPSRYMEDNEDAEMPTNVRQIWERLAEKGSLWRIEIHDGVFANGYFYSDESMEFDFSTREVTGQEQFDAVCDFVRFVGTAAGKPVVVYWEGPHDRSDEPRLMAYDPVTDVFTR
jgi:hypothetical protein